MPRTIHRETLFETASVTQNTTVYTNSFKWDKCSGDASVLFSSSAGDITVQQQCSIDNRNWYTPVNSAGTTVGTIATNATVTAGTYVSYSPVLAPFGRYMITENNSAATNVLLYVVFQEDQ